ncbi:hypothetical protein [Hyphomonas sp.]|uniref:hypothetical protein n=1 Tax=Hyphomonas sp. TaxID=87 RepID=UPI003528F3FF
MSFLHPPSGFPPHLAVIWPLIWAQLLLLRAAVRAAYGKGVQYHWSVSPFGRVFLTSIDWIPGQKADRISLKSCTHFNDRLAAACDGRAATPAYLRNPAISDTSRQGRSHESHDPHSAVLSPRMFGMALAQANLPLPET